MSSLVIVAIPSADDNVWKISSEKIPHVTLCYLGEVNDQSIIESMVKYIEHVTSFSISKFGLGVSKRGLLGENNADVLFFGDKSTLDRLNELRSYFLADSEINKAYLSTQQFPEFQPHLTLGYPESPAHEDTRDYPEFFYIHFDKIALWIGDYVGPTFDLTYEDEMMQNDEFVNVLSHFGVRGMKWGTRRNTSSSAKSSSNGKTDTAPIHETVIGLKNRVQTKGVKNLTNEELQTLVTRLNLERQLSSLQSASNKKKATKFAKDLLMNIGKEQLRRLAADAAAKQIAKILAKSVLKV